MTDFIILIAMAWYVFTGYLFAELARQAQKQQGAAMWTLSYAAVVFGWIALIPPTVFANVSREARSKK